MRDWLALPLSPTSSTIQMKSGSSDELMTTDEEAYDIINKATTTEEEFEEENKSDNDEEISSWLSVLKVFSTKVRKSRLSTSTSSSSIESTRKVFGQEDIENMKDTVDDASSSTDTDNSTPSNSQIISSSSSSKYYQQERRITHVKIYWNHGGKKVQVTGEFDNWSASVNMVQDSKDTKRHVANIPMDLSKDIEFKFIVDGEWKYAADLPHRTDWCGNINNVVYKKTLA